VTMPILLFIIFYWLQVTNVLLRRRYLGITDQ
jgi:hypothetical protein